MKTVKDFNDFEERIIENPPTVRDVARLTLAEMNALSVQGELPISLVGLRTKLAVAISLEEGYLVGGSIRDVELAKFLLQARKVNA